MAEPESTKGEGRRPLSTLAIVLIVVVVVVAIVAAGLTTFFLWWRGSLAPAGQNQVVGSGNPVTEEQAYNDFTAVSVETVFDVEIARSSSFSISITADDNLFEYIEVSKTGDMLTIGLESGNTYRSQWPWTRLTLRAEITMPELREVAFSGATHGSVEGFDASHDIVFHISGASSLGGVYTTTGNAVFDVSGASSVTLTGGANDLLLTVSGASRLDLSGFPSHDASVSVTGASQATVNLDGHLAGDVSGASRLYYLGQPTLTVNTSDASTVGPKT